MKNEDGYAGDDTRAHPTITLPDGTTYEGDNTRWPSITLPDGTTYEGDNTRWPSTITMPDRDPRGAGRARPG